MGSIRNIAADLHFTRYMAMATEDPKWLNTSMRISGQLEAQLRAKYGKRIAPYFKRSAKPDENGDYYTNFSARKAVNEGPAEVSDFKIDGRPDPSVWAGRPSDNEYKAFEDYINGIAQELGMTGPQVQAALWMGAAKRTGVADESQGTFMQLFRKAIARRAKATEQTEAETLEYFITERAKLAGGPGALIGGSAGALAPDRGQQGQMVY